MSANMKLASISAPPWCLAMNEKHDWQTRGFLSAGRLPSARMTGAIGSRERRGAQLAARLVREDPEQAPDPAFHRVAAGQVVVPEPLLVVTRRRSVHQAPTVVPRRNPDGLRFVSRPGESRC